MEKPYVVALVGAVALALFVAGVWFNRTGTCGVQGLEARWVEECAPVDENTVAATFLLRGYASRSISVGAELSVEDEVSGALLGSNTERVVVSGEFRERLTVKTDVDEDDRGDPDHVCLMTLADAGWHWPGR